MRIDILLDELDHEMRLPTANLLVRYIVVRSRQPVIADTLDGKAALERGIGQRAIRPVSEMPFDGVDCVVKVDHGVAT